MESRKLTKVREQTYAYFVKEVDPIISKCITYLLLIKPKENIPSAMLGYLQGDGLAPVASDVDPATESLPIGAKGLITRREQRMYLATKIGPVLTRIMNSLGKARPSNVVEFICLELQSMIDNKENFDIQPEDTGLVLPKQPNQRPYTASTRSKLNDAVQYEKSQLDPKDIRPGTAPQMLPPGNSNRTPNNNKAELESTAEFAPRKSPNMAMEVSDSVTVDKIAKTEQISAPTLTPKEVKTIQIAMLGIQNAGKTSIINALQGNGNANVKPTLGFKPTTMMLGEETKIKFYDLGGGKKIRDIWTQYYHDVHALIYVIDSTSDEEGWEDTIVEFKKVASHALLLNKPMLVIGNKYDTTNSLSINEICEKLGLETSRSCNVIVCSAKNETPEGEEPIVDSRLELGLEWLLTVVNGAFDELNQRVLADTKEKAVLEAKKRLARERKVLRNKMASAFFASIEESLRPDGVEPAGSEDIYDRDEGIKFLADEIGLESVDMVSTEALEVLDLIGFQRLAIQIVGALFSPISKKKTPMTWTEIKEMVIELRLELGLK